MVGEGDKMQNATNEPIPLPIIQECFEHWCTVQNVLILWDGGSSC